MFVFLFWFGFVFVFIFFFFSFLFASSNVHVWQMCDKNLITIACMFNLPTDILQLYIYRKSFIDIEKLGLLIANMILYLQDFKMY